MEFIAMGGYGAYVWPAFMAAAIIMIAMSIVSVRSLKHAEKMLRPLSPRDET